MIFFLGLSSRCVPLAPYGAQSMRVALTLRSLAVAFLGLNCKSARYWRMQCHSSNFAVHSWRFLRTSTSLRPDFSTTQRECGPVCVAKSSVRVPCSPCVRPNWTGLGTMFVVHAFIAFSTSVGVVQRVLPSGWSGTLVECLNVAALGANSKPLVACSGPRCLGPSGRDIASFSDSQFSCVGQRFGFLAIPEAAHNSDVGELSQPERA